MDTSKEYIKMCEKAVEIQKLWKPDFETGSVLWMRFSCVIMVDDTSNSLSGAVWLPRQDQLQEMLNNKFSTREFVPCLQKLSSFNLENFGREWSWEQLWLAFVMKEKFNKTWNGEEWNFRKSQKL